MNDRYRHKTKATQNMVNWITKMRTVFFAILVLVSFEQLALGQSLTDPIADADLVFHEIDGTVAVEAEHFISQDKANIRAWYRVEESKIPALKPDPDGTHLIGSSGACYLEVLPDSRTTHDDELKRGVNFFAKPNEAGVLTYKIHFDNPGRYYVWVRHLSTGSEDNGLHVGIDGTWPESGQRWQTTKKHKWAWESRQRTKEVHTGVRFKLYLDVAEAGEHHIHFSVREDGFEFDKFILASDRDFVPQEMGPAPVVKTGNAPPPRTLSDAYKETPAPVTKSQTKDATHKAASPTKKNPKQTVGEKNHSIRPPAGRIAIVADGNSPDPDDIGATAVMFGLFHATNLQDRLVHLSHSCDLKPTKRIPATDELRRQKVLHQICKEGVKQFGPFNNLANYFNCRTDQQAAVNDLRDAINNSTQNDPLWIIEAGEPDMIGYALQSAEPSKRQHVHVVSHHPANDNAGDFFSWQQILDFGVQEHQIGDQNVGLKTNIDPWNWLKEHPDPRMQWIRKQFVYAEQDGVVKFQTNKFDCSDAGMLYWWMTGASDGGDKHGTPKEVGKLLRKVPARGNSSDLSQVIIPPDGGQSTLLFAQDQSIDFETKNVTAKAEWASIQGMPFSQLYRVDSDTRFSDRENMQVRIPITEPIHQGDAVLISFWMRRPKAGGQPNNVYLTVNAKDDAPLYSYTLSAYREWKQHVRSFKAKRDMKSGKGHIRIDLGEAGKIVEIADLQLVNYGRDYAIETLPRSTVMYAGREKDAAWRKQALARIEKIRKGDLAITVVDAEGKPVPDAKVTIAMQQHAFGFGNTVNAEVLGADESDFPIKPKKKIQVSWEDAQKYRQVVKKYFDRVTFEAELRPHIWQRLQQNNRSAVRKKAMLMDKTVPWLRENDITARGHYIAWAPMDYNEFEKQFLGKPEEHRKWLWAHMNDVLPATNGFVTEWDTINHIIGWGKHTYEIEYGGPEIYAQILAEARRLAPDATHAINEGKVLPDGYKREPYKKIIRFLNDQGQPPDVVGFMGHFGLTSLTPPEELLQVYDEFAELAPRLQLSEFDVEAGDDEELQADYYRDVMIASFSHPSFVAIVQWGFWESMHWKPAAALWREDWTLKPSGEVFVDLVANQWWTDEVVQTDRNGQCQVRGFLGDYEITVQTDTATKKVSTAVATEGVVLKVQIP